MKERPVSVIWNYFTKLSGPEMRARCNYCETAISIAGKSTSNLKRHLLSQHKDISLPEAFFRKQPYTAPKTPVPIVKYKKPKSSDVWVHFTPVDADEEKKFKCNYCSQIIAGNSSSNLNRHLRLLHKTVTISSDRKNRLSLTSTLTEGGNVVVMEVPSNHFTKRENAAAASPQKITISFPAPSSFEMDSQSNSPLYDYDDAPPSPSPSFPPHSTLFTVPPEQIGVSMFDEAENKFDEIKKPISKKKGETIDTQLTKTICKVSKECHPFSLVEHEEFKQFVEVLCPTYKIPTAMAISKILVPSLYRTTKDELKYKLSQATTICLTCEGWTSHNETTFQAVTAHFCDEDMTRHSHLVEFSEFNKEHSVTSVSQWLDEALKKYNIKNKIVAAVTENNGNIKSAIYSLSIWHIPCYAHSLNLVVKNAVNESLKDVVNKVEALVRYLKINGTAVAHLLENVNNPQFKLEPDGPSKWNSTFEKFHGVLKNKKIIDYIFEMLPTKYLINLDVGEWEILEHAVMLLEIFEEVLKEVGAEEKASLSKTCILSRILVSRVEEFLFETREIMLPYEITDLGNQLLQGLNQRFGDRENSELISQALFLDPRFKKQGFGEEERFNLTYSTLAESLRSMESSSPSSQPTVHHTQPEPQVKSSSLWEEFDATLEMEFAENDTNEGTVVELDKYVAEPNIHRTSDPLAWWRERKSFYPNLYEIARQRLCIPATSVPSEHAIKAEQILNDKNFNLNSSNMLQILFVNSNLE